ncbi:hypothetical protein [Methylobacterium sp. 77]|uniref:hypothetical protein n=1 Tax=Methylobacterium sp. 77 TaxID=1101192 RepID=UPI0018CB398F|nr:hypothetical protein [Methylobacterium sp. 77]
MAKYRIAANPVGHVPRIVDLSSDMSGPAASPCCDTELESRLQAKDEAPRYLGEILNAKWVRVNDDRPNISFCVCAIDLLRCNTSKDMSIARHLLFIASHHNRRKYPCPTRRPPIGRQACAEAEVSSTQLQML